jgi:hypothetical protein
MPFELTKRSAQRRAKACQQVIRLFPAGVPEQYPQPAWVFLLMGAAFVAIPIWFPVRRRAAFVKVAAAQ